MQTKILEDILFQVYELGVQQTDCDITENANTIRVLANQRVVEELNSIASFCQGATEEMIYESVTKRIQELKQD